MHLADVGNDDIEFVRLGAISLQMLPSFRRCKEFCTTQLTTSQPYRQVCEHQGGNV